MDRRKERVPAEILTITIPPFTTSKHPFEIKLQAILSRRSLPLRGELLLDYNGIDMTRRLGVKGGLLGPSPRRPSPSTRSKKLRDGNLGCIFLFHSPSRGVAKRRRKIQCSGNSSFPAPFPFFSIPFGSAKRNTQFEENRRKRKSWLNFRFFMQTH